jgi:hypothetical protein
MVQMSDDPQRHFADSDILCRYIADMSGDTALISFSTGKDALAAWFRVRPYFARLVPFYMYLVPELGFVERSLQYYEERLGTPILRLPHPGMVRMLRELVFQPPERIDAIECAVLPRLTYEHVEAHVRRLVEAPNAYVAIGTRTADSPIRLTNVRRYGAANHKRRSFFPVFDWKLDDVIACIQRERIKLPVDYRLFGRTFDGLDYRFLEPIRREFPEDYERILAWFPMADLELKRREYAARRTV